MSGVSVREFHLIYFSRHISGKPTVYCESDMTDESASAGRDQLDVEEFIVLFGAHQRRLFQHILAILPNLQDAEDVLQETNLVLWRKFTQFRRGTSFLAWASRVAYLEVLKFREVSTSRRLLFLDERLLDQLAVEAIEGADYLDAVREALQGCLLKLSTTDRELVTSRYIKGTSGKRLADELGRPRNSIYKSLGRIRQVLLHCIDRTLGRSAAWGGGR